jgi:hypothetical protein
MNYHLLLWFLFWKFLDLAFYWYIADYIPIELSRLQIVLGLFGIELIVTNLAFPEVVKTLYDEIMNKN